MRAPRVGFYLLILSIAAFAQVPQLEQIAAIDDDLERTRILRERTASVETIEGRLMLLEEAGEFDRLRIPADRIRIDLLLLAGRTAEAGAILAALPEGNEELALRLALVHGEVPLPPERAGGPAGTDLAGIRDLRESGAETPEAYASRRGLLVSAAILLAPESGSDTGQTDAAAPLPTPADADDSAATTGGKVAIQVGAFSSRENAESHLGYLRSLGIDGAIIRASEDDGKTLYRTVIGGIDPRNAQRVLIQLKEKRVEGFILY